MGIETQITKFMGPTWGPPGSCRPQMGPCWPHEPCYQGRPVQNDRRLPDAFSPNPLSSKIFYPQEPHWQLVIRVQEMAILVPNQQNAGKLKACTHYQFVPIKGIVSCFYVNEPLRIHWRLLMWLICSIVDILFTHNWCWTMPFVLTLVSAAHFTKDYKSMICGDWINWDVKFPQENTKQNQ